MKKRNKILLLFSLIVMAVILILGTKSKINSGWGKSIFNNQEETNVVSARLKNKKPLDILLLGYGGGNHEGAYLTDSMMIVRIDPNTQNIILISIPRDIGINIPTDKTGGKLMKINTAYAVGMDDKDYPDKPNQYKSTAGIGNLVKATVGEVTGFAIDRFIAADFSSFATAIDTVGGVDVRNDQIFDDYAYPLDGHEDDLCGQPLDPATQQEIQTSLDILPTIFPCRYEHIHYDQGTIHLDGTNALKFVRSRHSETAGSDFARSSRQRNLLIGLRTKILSLGILPKLLPLYQSLKGHVSTDLSLDEIKTFITALQAFANYKIKSIALNDQNILSTSFSDDGQYILVPKAGKDNWNSVHSWLISEINNSPNNDPPIVSIINGTTVTGLAASEAGKLKDMRISAAVQSTSSMHDVTKTTITLFDGKLDPNKLKEIETEFGAKAVLSDRMDNSLPYNVLVVIGSDFSSVNK